MATAVKTKPPSLGATIDQIWAMREEKRNLESQAKDIEARIKEAEEKLIEQMQADGLDKATGKKASVSISSSVVADVKDWDAFYAYIGKNKFWHLLQRRVSDPAYRELLDAGKKVSGVLPFNKSRLNVRTLS